MSGATSSGGGAARGALEGRMGNGWTIPWYSSFGGDFNYDFHVTLDQDVAPVEYNYRSLAELGPGVAGVVG